jgi:phosphoglycerate dehydrogenase-like enzyme
LTLPASSALINASSSIIPSRAKFKTVAPFGNAVKELVISSMLLASRNICQAWDYVNSLPLSNLKTAVEEGKKNYAGSELPGKTLGIVGSRTTNSLKVVTNF